MVVAIVGGIFYGPGALGPEGDAGGVFSDRPPVPMGPGGTAPLGLVGVPLRASPCGPRGAGSAPSVQPPCAVGRGLLEEGTRLGAGRGCGSLDAMCDPCGVAPKLG